MSIANVVAEAEKYAVEVEAAGEGVERAAEKGSEVERDDAATVAMAAKAAVAEAAPVAVNPDASDSGTEEAATPTAQGIFLTADKTASGYSMQDQDDEAIEEAVAKSSDEHSQTSQTYQLSDRGETITIDEAGSPSHTSQVISRSGQRSRSIQVKRKNDEKNEEDIQKRLQKRKLSGPFHSMNESTCRNTRSEWACENSLNSVSETIFDEINRFCQSRCDSSIILTYSIPTQKGAFATISCRDLKTIVHNELLNSNLVDFGLKLILGIVSGGKVRNHGSVKKFIPREGSLC
jgi:hypothetical protein